MSSIVAAAVGVALLSNCNVQAPDTASRRPINILIQPLESALRSLADARGFQIVFVHEDLQGLSPVGVTGRLTTEEAIDQLLYGTNLGYCWLDRDTITIVPRAERTNATFVQVSTVPTLAAVQPATRSDATRQAAGATESTSPITMGASSVEEVVVTGSRISLSGYQAPTPVTVVGLDQLHRDNYVDVATVLSKLPNVNVTTPLVGGTGSISGGTLGLATVGLRGLGTNRTLVLYDGVRASPATINGVFDLNMIPSALVERMEVVTGGASAAWGSDAVAGVVNVVLNRNFNGLLMNVQGGINQEGTSRTLSADITFGQSISGGRGNIALAASILYAPDLVPGSKLPWWNAQSLFPNPEWTATNGQPRYIHVDHISQYGYARGGNIRSGPLAGIQFLENGVTAPFDLGTPNGSVSWGGDWTPGALLGQDEQAASPLTTQNLFASFNHEITNDLTFNLDVAWTSAAADSSAAGYIRNNNVPINIDNPYLSQSMVERMNDAGITQFMLSTTNGNVLNAPYGLGQDYYKKNIFGANWQHLERTMFRQVAGLEGSFGDWKWNFDAQHSRVTRRTWIYGAPIITRYNDAVDAVLVTTANVGTSGLPVGSIACRSTLTNPTNGCIPLNLLGINVANPAATQWVTGGDNKGLLMMEQYSVDFAVQGKLFSLPAGDVVTAVGGDWRRESLDQRGNEFASVGAYSLGNYPTYKAHQSVWEAFAEVDVPILSDRIVDSLALNGAVRYTEYDVSGSVVTWKVGLTSQITPDIRFRGVVSRDIRAPTLSDIFSPRAFTRQTVTDVAGTGVNQNSAPLIQIFTGGNTELKPEIGETISLGAILTPRFIPNLNVSVDWYRINLTDALASAGVPYILQQCAEGRQEMCALTERDSTGLLLSVRNYQLNIASQLSEGVDIALDYSHRIGPGRLILRSLATHRIHNRSNTLGVIRDTVGSIAPLPASVPGGSGGSPSWEGNLQATYDASRWQGTVGMRWLGSAKLSQAWGSLDVDDNHVSAYTVFDLRANYYLDADRKFQIYGAVDNVLDRDPPIVPRLLDGWFYIPTRVGMYDLLGRVYRIGARAKF